MPESIHAKCAFVTSFNNSITKIQASKTTFYKLPNSHAVSLKAQLLLRINPFFLRSIKSVL